MTLVERKTMQLGSKILIDIEPESEYVVIRVQGSGGEISERIKKSALYGAVFMFADHDTQDRLMPVRKTEVLTFERIHNVQLKKDMKKGQIMRVKCHMDVPVRIEESLKGLVGERTAKSVIQTL